jgi:DNA-binding CsgD family transcriptional regulator
VGGDGRVPLLGRDAELGLIADALGRDGCCGVVITGDAGVGKSRLAAEALAVAADAGAATHRLLATTSLASVPFGVVAPLLAAQHSARRDPLDAVLDAIRSLGASERSGRIVLTIDDAHLLDPGSVAVVQLAATTGLAFVLLTLRAGKPVPDGITALWKDAGAERVDLQPLSRREVGDLAEAVLGGRVDEISRVRLWEASQGNPLVLLELLAGGRSATVRDGVWRWVGVPTDAGRLEELLGARLGDLAPPVSDVAELVTLWEPLPLGVLESITGAAAVEEAEASDLIRIETSGRRTGAAFAHPLYGEVVRRRMPALRRRSRARQLAGALEGTAGRRAGDTVALAEWSDETGDTVDGRLLAEAASILTHGFARSLAAELDPHALHAAPVPSADFRGAERLARRGWELSPGAVSGVVLAEILMYTGRPDEADEVLAEAQRWCVDDEERFRVVDARSDLAFWVRDRPDLAAAVLAEAEGTVSDPAIRADITMTAGGHVFNAGDTEGTLAVTAEVLCRPDAGVRATGRAAATRAAAMMFAGRPVDALELLDAHEDTAIALFADTPLVVAEFLMGRAVALRLLGRYDEAAAILTSCVEMAVASGSEEGLATFGGGLGLLVLDRGHVQEAIRRLTEADARFADVDPAGHGALCAASLARAHAMAGNASAAAAAATRIAARRRRGIRVYDTEIEIGTAWAAAAGGDVQGAGERAIDAASGARARGQHAMEAFALHEATRLGAGRIATRRLNELRTVVQGDLMTAWADHASARDGAALDAVSATFEAMGADLLAAEGAAEAAVAHRTAGLRSRALASDATATRLAAACGGARTPALLAGGENAGVRLTRRERDIARLAAEGRSNAEIADRLQVSVRTVEGHLYQAFAKLGVTRRSDLAGLADVIGTLSR